MLSFLAAMKSNSAERRDYTGPIQLPPSSDIEIQTTEGWGSSIPVANQDE